MICHAKHTVSRAARTAWCLAAVLLATTQSARAQVTFRLSTDDILSAVRVAYDRRDGSDSGSLPVLNDRFSAGFSFLVPSPLLTLAGDTRAIVSLEPEVALGDTNGGDSSARLGTRFMPAATLGILGNPSERLSLGVFGHAALIADMTAGNGVFATILSDTSPAATSTVENSATTSSDDGSTESAVSLGLPANSWVGEAGALARAGLTPTVKPTVAFQYRVFRYLDRYACTTSATLDGTLPPQNYENDALVLDSRWVSKAGDRVGYSADIQARRDINRPYATCVDTVSSGVADIYDQVNPAATFFTGEQTWQVAVRPGVAFLWGSSTAGNGSSARVDTGLRVLPTASALGSVKFEHGDVSARAGLEAATLFGQSAPSYNAGADLQATWKPRELWTLRAGAAFLRTMPLDSGEGEASLPVSNAMTLWTGSSGVEWLPKPWVTLRADYVFSYQILDPSQTGEQDGSTASSPNRLRWHVLSLAASFALGGGIGSDFRPRIEAGMGR